MIQTGFYLLYVTIKKINKQNKKIVKKTTILKSKRMIFLSDLGLKNKKSGNYNVEQDRNSL